MISVWSENSHLPEFEKLTQNIKTDVLIIGGGIAGILCAYFFKALGADYCLVEAEKICSGVTKDTTAKITFQHGLIFDELISKYGREAAKIYLEINKNALGKYRRMCRKIDCDFEERASFVYSTDDREKIENEIIALSKLGYEAKFHEKIPLPFKIAGAISLENQAQFNPLKFISSISKDLKIYENTPVLSLEKGKAITPEAQINAENIIVATHFPMLKWHGSYFLKMYQERSYVIALEGAPDVEGMYVDRARGGLSFRNYKNMLLVGGAAHRTGKETGGWGELKDFSNRAYPDCTVRTQWATQDCITLDGMPYIGRLLKNTPGLYVATGFNKWGMTSSMVSAMLLADLICGKGNPIDFLFSPSRSILHPQLLMNVYESVSSMLKIPQKRCTHMGCPLKWNAHEHSWDCPCHGSRFTKDGRPIDNPAAKSIKE